MKSIDVVIPVKDGGHMLLDAVAGWLAQKLPLGWRMNLIVVNDGSTDGMPAELERLFGDPVSIVHHQRSVGRAGACNAGALVGNGEFIAFFDADCVPVKTDVLACLIAGAEQGADVVFGSIRTEGKGFWAIYLREVNTGRERRFIAGDPGALTTANCMIRRQIFERIGGFDAAYQRYGFEDRDLLYRLLDAGTQFDFAPNAIVIHGHDLDLEAISRKMRDAGQYTSFLFAKSHPERYRNMPFYRADVRNGGLLLGMLAWSLSPVLPIVAKASDWMLRLPLPMFIKIGIVRACTGAAYLVGTRRASRTD